MYRKELQNLLSRNQIDNFFFLYGADNFQSKLYADFIKEKYQAGEILKLFSKERSFTHASDFLNGGSLFNGKRLLEIETFKEIPTRELRILVEFYKSNKNNFLFLELYDEGSKQSNMERILSLNFMRFFEANNAREGIELLDIKTKQLRIEIIRNALFTLSTDFNENLYLVAGKLNKFSGLRAGERTIK